MTEPRTYAPSQAMDLSADEMTALARRLIADHIYWDTDWLQWENVPMLSEAAFMRLQDAVDVLTKAATTDADDMDRAENIDSMLLREQASNG